MMADNVDAPVTVEKITNDLIGIEYIIGEYKIPTQTNVKKLYMTWVGDGWAITNGSDMNTHCLNNAPPYWRYKKGSKWSDHTQALEAFCRWLNDPKDNGL
jgi:hypothetical protein